MEALVLNESITCLNLSFDKIIPISFVIRGGIMKFTFDKVLLMLTLIQLTINIVGTRLILILIILSLSLPNFSLMRSFMQMLILV